MKQVILSNSQLHNVCGGTSLTLASSGGFPNVSPLPAPKTLTPPWVSVINRPSLKLSSASKAI